MNNPVSQDLSRRRLLVSAAAGIASLSLTNTPVAMATPLAPKPADPNGPRYSLPTDSEVLTGNTGSLKIVNYAMYVDDHDRVDASRAEHQAYADALREQRRLVIGGPLLADDGRPRGVLLVYQVASIQEAEALLQNDPFVLQGAIADYRLAELSLVGSNVELLAASLVSPDRRAPHQVPQGSGAAPVDPDVQAMRTYVNYARYVPDRSRVERVRAAHRSYDRTIKATGKLMLAGFFSHDAGGMFIYRARSKHEAMKLVQADPYYAEGVFETSELSEWRIFGLNAGLIQSP